MLREVPSPGCGSTAADVRTYLALQEIGREVDQPQVIEYWKSAPYLLSFMDDYKLKSEVVAGLEGPAKERLAKLLAVDPTLLLPWQDVESYGRSTRRTLGYEA